MPRKRIHAAAKSPKLISFAAEVEINAAQAEGDQPAGPPKFNVTAYTGGALNLNGWDLPVVVELSGMAFAKSLIANLDHIQSQRVGHVTEKSKADNKLTLAGLASAATAARQEVIDSAASGFVWQASIEATPQKVLEIPAGKTVQANGQSFEGPLYLVKKSLLKGFAFVSHGADDNTSVSIAAEAGGQKGPDSMDKKFRAWIEAMLPGIDVEELTAEQLAGLEANYKGQPAPKAKKLKLDDGIEAKKVETERVDAITEIALAACDKRPYDIEAIKSMAENAIESKWTVEKFRLELLEASLPPAHTVFRSRRDERLTNRVIEAAICQAGRLSNVEQLFDEQTLEAADQRFRNGIGLKQLFLLAAESNGYRASYASDVNLEVQRAAFGMQGPRQIQASGFSTVSIATILSNTANKFLRDGWNAVDQTPLRIASVRNVRDFKEITTVSLTGHLQFEQLGPGGEIKHGSLGNESYTNKADTYAKMLAITRQDIINDDLGALTSTPKRLGRGAMLLLNHIFWTEFLNNSAFFTSARSNVNEGVADMTIGGLAATEAIFLGQTDPDGKPLGTMPAILLVPLALKATAVALMDPQSKLVTGASSTIPDTNVFRGRFRVECSPYMSNSAYTGYSASAWYMLADPNDLPAIEIAALNGRVEPTVETADADFNVLGVQMRGYSDVGVNLQEYRAGVRADGGSS